MYKLFLCLRYLRRRVIAYFAMIAVCLCVAMVLIVTSVMDGFLHKVEMAAKGLSGDIVIESTSLSGLGRYDELIAELHENMPNEIQAASPFIITFGILRVPESRDYRQTVQIAGIRLPERAEISDFAGGLHFQKAGPTATRPSFDPPISVLRKSVQDDAQAIRDIRKREEGRAGEEGNDLVLRLDTALSYHRRANDTLLAAEPYQQDLARVQRELDLATEKAHGSDTPETTRLAEQLDDLKMKSGFLQPEYRAILGLGIPGLSFRTSQGETVRFIVPGQKVELLVLPLGRKTSIDISPNRAVFSVVDDSRSDISSIDSDMVYLPFETLQMMNNMTAEFSAGDHPQLLTPARCSQIQIKVRGNAAEEGRLRDVCARVETLWNDFKDRHPDAVSRDTEVLVQTWRQRQAKIIAPIEKQRTLVITMFGVISLVAVVLIFVIFYMIVVQKTRDIGVLKSVGASSPGVAAIFLAYGAAVGLVGSLLGTATGYLFVRNINAIQDQIDAWFGWRVWDREWFLFEKIPSEVQATTAVYIILGAVVAGLLGALIPAIRAARMQPVEALRYE
jgi:lipoprotein-releasing system permease protein